MPVQTMIPSYTIDDIVRAYGDVEMRVVRRVAASLKKGEAAPDWELRKLIELESVKRQIVGDTSPLTVWAAKGVKKLLEQNYAGGAAEAVLTLGKTNLGPLQPSKELYTLMSESVNKLNTVQHTVLRTTEDAYRRIIREVAAPGMLLGIDNRQQAIQNALNKFADQGITGFVDKAGRNWDMRSYVEMATGTAVHRASTQGHLDSLSQRGHDLVVVSDHGGECELCRPWEGKVLSITGSDGHMSVGQAQMAGLEHPGCRHRYSAWFEGISKPPKPQGKPEDYTLRSQQRDMERQLRAWKRREAAGDPKAPSYVKAWQKKIKTHVDSNPTLKRRYDREQPMVGKKNVALPLKAYTTPVAPKPVPEVPKFTPIKPTPAPVAATSLVSDLKAQATTLEAKLSNVKAGSPWGKKYAKDLSEVQAKLAPVEKDLTDLQDLKVKLSGVNPDSPWGKKYIKQIEELEGKLKAEKLPTITPVKPPAPAPKHVAPAPKAAPAPTPEVAPKVVPKVSPSVSPTYTKPIAPITAKSKGITFWKSKPAPVNPTEREPVIPAGPGAKVFKDWLAEAKKRFYDFAMSKNNPKSDLTKSNHWGTFVNVSTTGDLDALKILLREKYIDQKMYDEALDLIKKANTPEGSALVEYQAKLAAYKAAKEQFNLDVKDWRKANGIPEPKLRGFEKAVIHKTDMEGVRWSQENLPAITGPEKTALRTYTGGDYRPWNAELRRHKGVLPESSRWVEMTTKADKGFKPCPVDMVVSRGSSMEEFLVNGNRSRSADPMELIGTVQTNHAYTSTSVGRDAAFGGDVQIKFMVPEGHPIAYVQPFSRYERERELVLSRNTKYFVHNVYRDDRRRQWIVEAEILPEDVDVSTLGSADISPSSRPF